MSFREKLASKTTLDWTVYFLILVLIFMIGSRIYFRLSRQEIVESKTLVTLKINKICMDLPSGVTECVEGNSSLVYKVLVIQDPNDHDVSTIYLKVK